VYEHKEYKYTDVFALGMVIFFMLAGERPFADVGNALHVERQVSDGKRPDITKLPVEYRALVSRCWEHGVVVRLVGLVSSRTDPLRRITMQDAALQIHAIQPMKIRGSNV
jgi:serine/threonine protein kinase